MKSKDILATIRTYAIVGAASILGAALWTNVLENKVQATKERITRSKSDKIIDFKTAKRRMSR